MLTYYLTYFLISSAYKTPLPSSADPLSPKEKRYLRAHQENKQEKISRREGAERTLVRFISYY
nr:MAG TPA: hypothetical protein [Caudoviricetes sp.]